ncbi:hypothetical protein NDN08_008138 [Rhodosorus marinus]|uniref:Uncharacterized protein n=1 Tax=Rhodosorus marinus TaxID=101924 RepID=A0AAV8V2C3_9RHOD|nr:hypothetical protein NDN08_008138 [Rhodosorus marinus]
MFAMSYYRFDKGCAGSWNVTKPGAVTPAAERRRALAWTETVGSSTMARVRIIPSYWAARAIVGEQPAGNFPEMVLNRVRISSASGIRLLAGVEAAAGSREWLLHWNRSGKPVSGPRNSFSQESTAAAGCIDASEENPRQPQRQWSRICDRTTLAWPADRSGGHEVGREDG